MKSEHLEQVELVAWFRKTYPKVRIFAIPNGGARSVSQGMALKAEGTSKGVPDIFIPEWLLWIEMKRQTGGVLSPEQKDWIQYLKFIGHKCIVGRGFEDAQKQVLEMIKGP